MTAALPPARPGRTTVVAVGIEQYAAGSTWDLPGPAADVHRFLEWIAAQGVPAERMTAFLSTLPDATPGPPPRAAVATQPAGREQIRTALVRTVPALEGDLLVVIWGGHGLVSGTGRRHLFTADATAADPLNLNLDSLLRFYRSAAVPSFRQQLWIIDACQTFHDIARSRLDLPDEEFGARDLLPGRVQEILLAASPGERALNLAGERTGLFSRETLRLLSEADTWPPDVPGLARQLVDNFSALRERGAASQTPAYVWVRDRSGTDGQLLSSFSARPATATTGRGPSRVPAPLVNALVALPGFSSQGFRDLLVASLRPAIRDNVARQERARPEALSLVLTCGGLPGGLDELVEVARACAGDQPEVEALADAVAATRS